MVPHRDIIISTYARPLKVAGDDDYMKEPNCQQTKDV